MPCYLTGSAQGDTELTYREVRNQVTKLTRILCEACQIIEDNFDSNLFDTSDELYEWWENHKKIDKERKERDKKKKQNKKLKKLALSKLSKEEIEALGL